MTMKTTFVKEKDMEELACSLEERVAVKEEGTTIPLYPYFVKL